ncbi:MAG: hypothetical protein U9O24_10220 [Campylobacterota bacterium]|nr:hypothetical protein [Campylobacterota bacterium]
MRQEKPSLETLLSSSRGKEFLFLGREGLFTKEEIARFLKKNGIGMTKYLEEGVVATIEHGRLNPVEEDISNDAYDAKIPSFSLETFEKLLSEGINNDELLMVIKLSNDQNRIFRLLGNENISEDLFVKLLAMYKWHDEEEDDRNDRDTIMYTLRRYIDIKPNEADLLYSYLTLRRLATEATNPKLLLALIGFQNFEFLIRGKEKVTLRETIARNRYLDKELILKLVSFRELKIDIALASNPAVALSLLEKLLAKESVKINEALATNKNIDDKIFDTLLSKEDNVVQLLLLSQAINLGHLARIDTHALDANLFATLGANKYLECDVIDLLIGRDNEELTKHLAQNDTLDVVQLQKIYAKGVMSSFEYLAVNPSSSVEMLEMLYEKYDEPAIHIALAHNKSTPEAILRALFERDEFEIYKSMASNSSLPMELLDILKVDTRLQNELAKNEIFVKEYETVLDYDKKAIQF